MSTIHNPVNFEPSDYSVVGYFDNQRPKLPVMFMCTDEERKAVMRIWQEEVERWEAVRNELFPDRNDRKCQHCGQGNVRYVVSAMHAQTGKHICFGDICCERLSLPNHDAFRAKHIRSKAANDAAAAARLAAVAKFIGEHPELKNVSDNFDRYSKNSFICDVIGKLRQYGSLSERQIEAVVRSSKREDEFAAKREEELSKRESAGVEPIKAGRYEVEGEVISTKFVDNDFGGSTKMLVKSGFHKFWVTVPASLSAVQPSNSVRLTAEWTPSPKDAFFAFGSRPAKASILKAA